MRGAGLVVDGEGMDEVDEFKYVGIMRSTDGEMGEEVNHWLLNEWKVWEEE